MNSEIKIQGYIFSDPDEVRKKSLRKAIVIYGPKELIKKLKYLYIVHKLDQNSSSINSDIKWINNTYKKKSLKKSTKKSLRKKSKRKSRRKK